MRYPSLVILAVAAAPFSSAFAADAQFAGPSLVIYNVGQNYGPNDNNSVVYNGMNSAYYGLSWANGAQASDITVSGQLPQGLSFQTVTGSQADASEALFGTAATGTEGTYNLSLNSTVNGTQYSYPVTLVVESPSSTMTSVPSGITGNWYGGSSQSGQGFSIEVLANSLLLAQWYTFAPNGGPTWISGTGTITGNMATVQGYQVTGSGAFFPPNFVASNVQPQAWGTLTFTFFDCNYGLVTWDTSATNGGTGTSGTGTGGATYANGSMAIERLTSPDGLTCTDSSSTSTSG